MPKKAEPSRPQHVPKYNQKGLKESWEDIKLQIMKKNLAKFGSACPYPGCKVPKERILEFNGLLHDHFLPGETEKEVDDLDVEGLADELAHLVEETTDGEYSFKSGCYTPWGNSLVSHHFVPGNSSSMHIDDHGCKVGRSLTPSYICHKRWTKGPSDEVRSFVKSLRCTILVCRSCHAHIHRGSENSVIWLELPWVRGRHISTSKGCWNRICEVAVHKDVDLPSTVGAAIH